MVEFSCLKSETFIVLFSCVVVTNTIGFILIRTKDIAQVGTQMYLASILNMAQSPKILDSHPYLRQTLELVSDKWVTAIIYVLSHGTKRYGELHREIGDVSQRMLTRTLRDLERDGLVRRKVYTSRSTVTSWRALQDVEWCVPSFFVRYQ